MALLHLMCINTVYDSTTHKKRKKSYPGATLHLLIKQKKTRVPFHFPSAILSRELFEDMGGFELQQMYSSDGTFAIKLGYLRELLCMPPVPIIKEQLFVWNRHSHSITTIQGNQYKVHKCQKAQRKPLRKAFLIKLLDCEICFGDNKGVLKDAMGIYDNLSESTVELEEIFEVQRAT
jgi:hypothetical protein